MKQTRKKRLNLALDKHLVDKAMSCVRSNRLQYRSLTHFIECAIDGVVESEGKENDTTKV